MNLRNKLGLDKMRAKQGLPPPQEKPAQNKPFNKHQPPKPTPNLPCFTPGPNAPPVTGWKVVRCKCGHDANLPLYLKDKFLDKRVEKAEARDCPPCSQKKLEEIQKAAADRRRQRADKKWIIPRLPGGSNFNVTYDEEKVEWSGTLTTTLPDGKPVVLTGTHSAVLRLLRQLDKDYREAIRQMLKPLPKKESGEKTG